MRVCAYASVQARVSCEGWEGLFSREGGTGDVSLGVHGCWRMVFDGQLYISLPGANDSAARIYRAVYLFINTTRKEMLSHTLSSGSILLCLFTAAVAPFEQNAIHETNTHATPKH